MNISIRNKTAADMDAITHVTVSALKTLPVSNHTKHYIIHSLGAARVLIP